MSDRLRARPATIVSGVEIFDRRSRTDRTSRKANESQFAFLNRTGSDFFVPVRDLLQTWLNRMPAQHRRGVIGNLRAGDDAQFESAFWELYLHQVVTSTGLDVSIHPDVPGTSKHPDFLVHAPEPFYLEAVSVGTSDNQIAELRRMAEVEAVLDQARATGWTLSLSSHEVGPNPPKATRLRSTLLRWLEELTEREVAAAILHTEQTGGEVAYPVRSFSEDGWDLEFTALPTAPGRQAPLVAARGAGRAVGVDNKSGLRQVLDSKARRYGQDLPHPLVTAALSNTTFPTRLYEIQPVLFGLHWLGPARVTNFSELADDGHWRTKRGWRRSHNPYVVVGAGINPYSIHRKSPWQWHTLDPTIDASLDLPWAAPIDTKVPEPDAPDPHPDLIALGIDADWCHGDPDFQ